MRVRIYQPARTAMQSGRAKTHQWLIAPELITARLPESLMGWVSAGDTLTELQDKLRFGSAEEAIIFAQRNGWEYYVEDPEERKIKPRSYLDNFKIVRPQDEERNSKAE
jgi:hypothetical protein